MTRPHWTERIRSPGLRLLIVGGLTALVLVVTYSFAAANVVPASKAGDGSGAITGFTISAIVYVLNAADPTKIDKVKFTLNSVESATATKKIKLVAAGANWYACTDPLSDGKLECITTAPQATTAGSDSLEVVVAD